MKRLLLAAALAVATFSACAADVGVSIEIGQPGFYGRLDIGGYPQPRLIYRQPVAVWRVPAGRQPIYMHVPPGHAKNWRKHCRAYGACDERVYFVQDNWYNREYVPRYRESRRDRRDQGHDGYRDDRRDNRRDHGRDR
jgi:hypothetical protein